MDPWLTWRLVKFLAILGFAGGVLAAVAAPAGRQRRLAAAALTPAAALLTWAAGWQMMKLSGRELSEPWILGAVVLSLTSVLATLWLGRAARSPVAAGLALAGLAGSTSLMVVRDGTPLAWATAIVATALGAALAVGLHGPSAAPLEEGYEVATFRGIARAEGLSLVVLLGSTASKSLAALPWDGGTGVIGWSHGMLTILFLPALVAAGRAARWSVATMALGLLASLVPFGTFVFEWATSRSRPG